MTSPSPTHVFVTSNILDKTSENLLSYLLVDARMGTVAHREQYIFYSDPGHVPQTKTKVQGTLVYLDVMDSLTFSSVLCLFHLKTLMRTHC